MARMVKDAAFSTSIGSDVFAPGCLEWIGADYGDIELTDAPYEHVRCTKEIFEDARKNYPEMYAAAQAMALAGYRVITEPETLKKIRDEFEAMPK